MENKKKPFTVEISERAATMLTQHAAFLANVSENAAKRLINEFKANVKILELTPEIFPWLSDPMLPEHKYRKLIFEKRYLIVYQLKHSHDASECKSKNKTVYVDAVVDCRQDYSWLLK